SGAAPAALAAFSAAPSRAAPCPCPPLGASWPGLRSPAFFSHPAPVLLVHGASPHSIVVVSSSVSQRYIVNDRRGNAYFRRTSRYLGMRARPRRLLLLSP